MAFLEDPRLRQRWNRITQDAETVTENAAAGIWNFQQHYINPCLGSVKDTIEQCTTVCLGDPEERLRRQRERARERAEYSFNFYDDWDRAEESGGLLGNWGGEDWDRLLAGSGNQKRHEIVEQPRRKRGMSYGTRGSRRKTTANDPTIIPSTQPIGFLNRFSWRMRGPLRYRPSAADLQDNPGARRHHIMETQPLLGREDDLDYDDDHVPASRSRKRSGTNGSGATSDSYRSRGDLFPSDGEGDEDAIALDGEVTYDMIRRDDRSSGKSGRTLSSKGKRPAGLSDSKVVSRAVSRTTLGSIASKDSLRSGRPRSLSITFSTDTENVSSPHDLESEEYSENENNGEDEELTQKKDDVRELKLDYISPNHSPVRSVPEPKPPVMVDVDEEPADKIHEDEERNDGGNETLKTSEVLGKDSKNTGPRSTLVD